MTRPASKLTKRDLAFHNEILHLFLTVESEEIYHHVLRVITRALCSQYGVFGYLDKERNLICLDLVSGRDRRASGFMPPVIIGENQWEGLWGRALAHGQMLTSNSQCSLSFFQTELENCLVVPIIHDGEVAGIFCVAECEGGYTRSLKNCAKGLATCIAMPLKNRLLSTCQQEKNLHSKAELSGKTEVPCQGAEMVGHTQWDFDHLNRIAAAICHCSDAVIITDSHGKIQYVNPAFEASTGYTKDEAIGQSPGLLKSEEHSRDFYRHLWQTISNGKVWKGQFINRTKDGRRLVEEAAISPVIDGNGTICNYVAVKKNITRELELKKQIRQAAKMEAVGTLAGGIAHDFNNILGAMIGYTRLAMEEIAENSQPYLDLTEVLSASERATELVRQMLLFGRSREERFVHVQLSSLIKETCKMLRASLPVTISLQVAIARDCPPVMADPTQMQQVLMNLATNAKQAMESNEGCIEISLSQEEVSTEHQVAGLKTGNYLVLKVCDTGSGMTEEEQGRIFDPFYTTKPAGEGTGLGLSVVHGIVKSHRGVIIVSSESSFGSTFSVYLPSIERRRKSRVSQDITQPTGDEHILLVDDEKHILTLQKRILTRLGYHVTACKSSLEAIELFRIDPNQYDLLLTDMTLPDLDGRKLMQKMLTSRPDLPSVLCTGFSEVIDEQQALSEGFRAFLFKPVKSWQLAQTIRRVLDNG